MRNILLLFLISSLAYAGLPPTSSKVTGDTNNVTTFVYEFPNFSGTHTGTTLSLGILGISGGGSGLSSTSQNFLFAGPTSGSGAPSWRLLTSSDIPSLSSIYLPLTGGSLSGAIAMGSNQIHLVTDPTSAQDAATKNYVDLVASSLQPIQAVYAGSTANIPGTYVLVGGCANDTFTITATGALSLDGTNPPANSRVLLKNQTSGYQNGVYNVTVAGTTGVSPILTRVADYNSVASINAGDLIPVINGTANAQTSWLQTSTISSCGVSGQNLVFSEWTANPANYLLKSNNLSDVSSQATALSNILGGVPLSIANGGTNNSTALSSNGILFYNGTKVTNSSTFVDSSGSIGIGLASPTTQFSIQSVFAGTDVSDNVFTQFDSGSTLRIATFPNGKQTWHLNSGTAEVGQIMYSTPNSLPGIIFENTSGNGRSQINMLTTNGGLGFGAQSGSGNPNNALVVSNTGQVGIGTNTAPAGFLTIEAGTTATPPLLMTSGTNTTTVNNGSIEYDGTSFYFSTGGTRYSNGIFTPAAHDVLVSGTGGLMTTVTPSSSGTVLTSNGVSADPSFQALGSFITALTGDVTASGPGSSAATLAAVNSNIGSFTNANITVNGKGLITAASNGTAPVTTLAAVGASPNANAATISGNTLNLQPFSSLQPGVVGASGGGTTNFLRADGTWSAPSAGSGTVTSVTFTGDGTVLSSTPSSAVTTSGTVTGSLKTQTANTFLAGPTSGSAATPTFRAIGQADMPSTIAFKAVGSTSSITGSFAKLVWTTVKFDSASGYATGTYTVPTAGKYAVYSSLQVDSATVAAGNSTRLSVFWNGSEDSTNITWSQSTVATSLNVEVGDLIDAAAGDTIQIDALSSAGTPTITSSATRNVFTIYYLGK